MLEDIKTIIKIEPRIRRSYFNLLFNKKESFNIEAFSFEEAKELLSNLGINKTSETLSDLSRNNLIKIDRDKKDKRIKVYSINKIDFNSSDFQALIKITEKCFSHNLLLIMVWFKIYSFNNLSTLTDKGLIKCLPEFKNYWDSFVLTLDFKIFIPILKSIFKDEYKYIPELIDSANDYEYSTIKFITELVDKTNKNSLIPSSNKEKNKNLEEFISQVIIGLHTPFSILELTSGQKSKALKIYEDFENKNITLVIQDMNIHKIITNKLLLLILGVNKFKVLNQDCLTPNEITKADYVITAPPWNQKTSREQEERLKLFKEIYQYGMPSLTNLDWGWVQMATYLANKKAFVFLDSGSLIRKSREGDIRMKMIEADLIETVISLKDTLDILLIINKQKAEKNKGKIFFINLNHFDLEKLINVYGTFSNNIDFSCLTDIDVIAQNEYSLNPKDYVTFEDDITKSSKNMFPNQLEFHLKHSFDKEEESKFYQYLDSVNSIINNESTEYLDDFLNVLKVKDPLEQYNSLKFEKPTKWEMTSIREVSASITIGMRTKPLEKTNDLKTEGIKVLQPTNIGKGYFINNFPQIAKISDEMKINKHLAKPHEILISLSGDNIGYACILPSSDEQYLLSIDVVSIVINEKISNPQLIFHLLNSESFRKNVLFECIGSSNKRIKIENLIKIPMILPSKEMQNYLNSTFTKTQEIMTYHERKLNQINEIYNNLSTFMFLGHL